MDLRATIGYETFKKDGKSLFVETMTGADVCAKLATDAQTLVESAWAQRGQAAGAMMLCRLVGYVEGMLGVVAGIHQAGVQFIPILDEDGRTISLRVKLYPDATGKAQPEPINEKQPEHDLDELEGQEYEAALAKMSDADRAAHLKQQ